MSVLVENDIQASRKLISHLEHDQDNINFDKSQLEKNLKQKKDIVLPLSEELSLLNQLTQFELGRFLLSNKGLNGYWTSYIIIHGPKQQNLLPLEKWLLEDAPVVKATIERFYIFQKALQKNIREGIKIASIPCGLMDDLLFLNYNRIRQFTLLGIDLDDNSLELAKKNAEDQDVHVQFLKRDAW